jgi:hypothetical protein
VTIATDSTLCGAVHGPGAVGHLVAVLDPFPNIADEIVETEAVRLKTPDGRNLLEAIVTVGCSGGKPGPRTASVVDIAVTAGLVGIGTPRKWRRATRLRGVLPFRFAE